MNIRFGRESLPTVIESKSVAISYPFAAPHPASGSGSIGLSWETSMKDSISTRGKIILSMPQRGLQLAFKPQLGQSGFDAILRTIVKRMAAQTIPILDADFRFVGGL
jgi:hypothetical protein